MHEEGGHTEKTEGGGIEAVAWTPGEKRSGTNNGSVTPFAGTKDPGDNLLDNWHVHTSGSVDLGGGRSIESKLGPSTPDKTFAGKMDARGVTTLQVDTKGVDAVNFIGANGTKFSMSYARFIKMRK